MDETLYGDLIYEFVRLGSVAGTDRFFVVTQGEVQQMVHREYSDWLASF
ncbi:MAG: hypothetical protein OEN23_04940 [Paracoccaceae bacterium]|nr:hypothetical protein [Paracoccaceae bacterium]